MVTVHDRLEVSRHCSTKCRRFGDVKKIVGVTAARDKPMSLDLHVVGLCEANKTVDRVPVVMLFGWMEKRPLHLVVGGETVELLDEDGRKLRIVEVARTDSSGPDEDVLLFRDFPEWSGSGAYEGVECRQQQREARKARLKPSSCCRAIYSSVS